MSWLHSESTCTRLFPSHLGAEVSMSWLDWFAIAVIVLAWGPLLAAREKLLGRPVWPVRVR